jgi:hypothetical protein
MGLPAKVLTRFLGEQAAYSVSVAAKEVVVAVSVSVVVKNRATPTVMVVCFFTVAVFVVFGGLIVLVLVFVFVTREVDVCRARVVDLVGVRVQVLVVRVAVDVIHFVQTTRWAYLLTFELGRHCRRSRDLSRLLNHAIKLPESSSMSPSSFMSSVSRFATQSVESATAVKPAGVGIVLTDVTRTARVLVVVDVDVIFSVFVLVEVSVLVTVVVPVIRLLVMVLVASFCTTLVIVVGFGVIVVVLVVLHL